MFDVHTPEQSSVINARLASRRAFLRLLAGIGLVPVVPGTWRAWGRDGVGASEAGAVTDWASGGTVAMTAKSSYPDPFTGALDTCALVASTTAGPCTTEGELFREDVSEGWSGLPVRLALRVVDSSCTPLPGATVKVWHTNIEGSYSGQTPNNGMCLQQQTYASANFFRGAQTTGDDGVVYFDTCFPGWYRGRAIHIHFQVTAGTVTSRVSQLFFPEDITADVFANHGEYAGYGQPDTVFASDNIMAGIPAAQRDRHVLEVARMSDGAMLAAKTVTVVAGAIGPTATATPAPATSPTPTPTSAPAVCVGDCDGSGAVSVDELISGVNVALGDTPVTACAALDGNGTGVVTVDEVLAAVNAALNGCP